MAGGRTELEEQLAQSELDLEKQERVLGVLEQWRQDLIDYGETQAGLLDEREKELSRYTFAELPPFESKVRTRLPGTFTALGKLKGKELDEARDRIDDVIADRRREQEAKPTSRADRMITVESLDDFDDMTDEVETLREELSAYFKNAGTREQKDWYKNHPWNAISDNDRAELSEHSSYYEGTRQTYQTAKKACEDAEAQTDPEQEFEFFKSLVARKIILKQVVKDVGFHGISKARNFTQFQKLNDSEKAQVMDQVRTNLMLAGGADEMRLRGLGYTTPEFMQEALDDYLKIVGQVEQYGERIAARNISEQTDWIKKFSRTESSHYLDKNGNPKKGFEELTALSAGYEPYKDVIGEKERLRGEMESARIPYYQALLSRRLLQKEAIKSAVKAENKRIEAENALDEERRKDHERWKDQAACDDRFRENTSDEITLSRAKSIDLMAGTMITGFAGRMTEAFGNTVSRVGAVLAEGIVKGETRQLEKELADLEADLKRARRAVGAGAANAAEDLSSVKDEVRETGTVSEEAAKAVKSSGAHMQQVTDGAERVQELEKQISEKRAALDQARKNEGERLAAIEKQFRGEQSDQVKRDQARIDLEAIGNRIIAEHTADYVTSAQGAKSGSSQSQSSGSTAAGSSQSQSTGSTAAGSSQGVLSDEMLKALMAARTNLRQRDLMTQEADAIRKDRDLQVELVELQGYSDKLKDLMKPENLEKVDTAVSVASTFFEVYQKVSGFVRGKAEAGEDDDASGKDSDAGDDAAEEKEQEEAFRLDIRETLEALNQKAEKIKASMEEDQPDRTTLAHEVTDLTMECGALIRVLSGKINDYSTRLESELEETEARAEADRSFLDEAAKTPEMSVVELAKEELKSQRELAAKEQSADLAIRDAAIETQRKAVEEARKKRDELAARVEKERTAAATEGPAAQETGSGMTSTAASEPAVSPAAGTPVSHAATTSTSASSPASAAPGQTTTGTPAALTPEDDPLLAEKTLVARAGQQVALATENLKRKRAVLAQARRDVDARHRELVIIEDANLEARDEMTAWDDGPGEQYEKNAAFLKHQKDIADEDASRARKDGIKSAVYGIANDAAKGAKSFMDRLTVGVAEAVVKGRTRQLEDDLAEKEREYQLKGKTILAKNRQALRHTKNAGRYAEHSEQWELEMRQAAEMSGEAEKLTKERGEIGGEIRDLREKLAEARVREKKELAELDDKLHRAYGMDQEAVQEAHRQAQIRTDVNALKGEAAVRKVAASTAPFEDLITSAAYTEVDAEQRQLMEAEAKQFKQELAADEKGRQLMEISDQLKGLFTPKNLSRVDTMVNAAENLYKLYGKVRELTDGGDGDEAGEDEKDLTASVKEMKEKVSDIREKMMGGGEDTTEVVDAVLALADNMRAVTDQISGKIEAASKEAEAKWIESREISRESQRDYEVFSDGFRDHMERTVAEVVTPHMEEKLLDARIRMQERIDLAEDVVEQAQVDVNDAKTELDKKKAALKKAEDILARAEKSQIEMEERRKRAEAEIAAEEARKAAEEAKKAAEAKKLNEEKASDTAKGIDDAQIFEGSKEPDPRLEQLQDILDNLTDTGRGYFGHSNSKEYNDVVEKLTDYLADGRTSVDPSDPATAWLAGALAAYLDHTGMDTAWHKSGNIRKENILAALNLVDHDTALTYEARANKVRNSRSKISLDTLMDSEHIKRKEPRPTRDRTRSASGPELSGMTGPE